MATQSFSVPPVLLVGPSQVWSALAGEIQGRIITLLAVLAADRAVAQFQAEALQNKEEAQNAKPPK